MLVFQVSFIQNGKCSQIRIQARNVAEVITLLREVFQVKAKVIVQIAA